MDGGRYDWIVVGSGFGGSVSALRLAERGYSVLVIEKGRRFRPADFPKTNWNLREWMWRPRLGLRGFFSLSFFEHLTVAHGVGVGGGSLTYAATLPVPSERFFEAPSWAHLADWREELAPHYATAKRMLGAAENPRQTRPDRLLAEVARDLGREAHHHPTEVGIHFGEPGRRVEDPYFEGRGPARVGCTFCGGCMTGCRVGAKNTLDQNYLYLAERLGARIRAETEVVAVRPRSTGGYEVHTRPSLRGGSSPTFSADRVVFAGGVLGTVPLLLAMRADRRGLPRLSARVGEGVRTNSEALILVTAPGVDTDLTEGIAITSILQTDDDTHVEPVRLGRGSDFFRTMTLPHAPGDSLPARLAGALTSLARHPGRWARALTARDQSPMNTLLATMQTVDGSIRLERDPRSGRLRTAVDDARSAPTPFLDAADDVVERYAEKVGGVAQTMALELLRAVPSTAHVLGGACMGADADEGVIDAGHQVHGYDGLYVIDGSAISANPGVNPSLTITALAERAMSLVR